MIIHGRFTDTFIQSDLQLTHKFICLYVATWWVSKLQLFQLEDAFTHSNSQYSEHIPYIFMKITWSLWELNPWPWLCQRHSLTSESTQDHQLCWRLPGEPSEPQRAFQNVCWVTGDLIIFNTMTYFCCKRNKCQWDQILQFHSPVILMEGYH